jgi:Flp pilus assembly protein TadG
MIDPKNLMKRLRRGVARFAADRRGMSAVEFALLLPVMVMLYLGAAEISMAVATYRLVDLTANTVTNLVTQYTTISASTQMPDILTAATQVMYPNAPANVQVVVSLVSIDKNGNATIAWSQTLHGTARTVGAAVTVPAALDIPNTNVVLGETTVPYTAAVDFLNLGTYTLYSSIFMVPRAATTINLTA